MTTPKVITATTPLELAALRAMFRSVEHNWYGTFVNDTMRFYYQELGLKNDDEGAQLDTTELSELMIKWSRSVNYG